MILLRGLLFTLNPFTITQPWLLLKYNEISISVPLNIWTNTLHSSKLRLYRKKNTLYKGDPTAECRWWYPLIIKWVLIKAVETLSGKCGTSEKKLNYWQCRCLCGSKLYPKWITLYISIIFRIHYVAYTLQLNYIRLYAELKLKYA